MTAHLPTIGASSGVWGDELNEFLGVGHNSDGTIAPAGTDTCVQFNDNGVLGYDLVYKFDKVTNTLYIPNIASLTEMTFTDSIVGTITLQHLAAGGSDTQIQINNAGTFGGIANNSSNWDTAFGWGNHASAGYLTSQTSHTDVVVDGDFTSQGIMLRGASSGVYSILTNASANWNTAYNHSQNNSQAHSDYMLNTGDDATGTYTITNNGAVANFFFTLSTSADRPIATFKTTHASPSYILFNVEGVNSASKAFGTLITGESFGRFLFTLNGNLEWGSGSGARDTNLYRIAANQLKTDDWFGVCATPLGVFHANLSGGTAAQTTLIERSGLTSDAIYACARLLATKSTNMADGFGPTFQFSIQDDAGVINPIAAFGGVRAGADNTGDFIIYTIAAGSATEKLRITSAGGVLITTMKSGATKAASGAATNELWRTSGHATLPDGVVMIGI